VSRKQRESQWNRGCVERIVKCERNRKDVGGTKITLGEQKEWWTNKKNVGRIKRMVEE
jgi:hypothetical protein